jgi:2-polyprenyl-3-methyl-5-hydroxy-6-metoxy-1,4-benzoquinol methylase
MKKLSLKGEIYFKFRLLKKSIEERDKILELNEHDQHLHDKIMHGEWESNFPCNYCGSIDTVNYLKSKNINFYGQIFNLKKCTNCGLVFCDSRPNFEDILNYYKFSDWSKGMIAVKNIRPDVKGIHRNVIRQCLSYNKNAKSLFDIGTGGGTLLIEAKNMGLKVSGNDINRASSIYLMETYGINIFEEPTNKLDFKYKYDIITMLDYIEHSYTPFDDLTFACKHLADNGILYLKTLYLNCPNHKKMKDKWNLFGEGHYHYFTVSTLMNMIYDCNLKLLEVSLYDAIIKIIAQKI